MKILIVAPTYLPSRRANTIQVMKMAQATELLGHDVHVLVPNPNNAEQICWDILAAHYGLTQRFDIRWTPVKAGFRSYDYGMKSVIHNRKINADILYTRLPQAAALASILKIPTIFEVHDMPGGTLGIILFRLFLIGKGARHLVLITKSLRDTISHRITPLPDDPFTMVESDGVDLARYEDIPKPEEARQALRNGKFPELPSNRFTVGYTGHFYPGRGVELILHIAASCSDITFLLVGGDPPVVTKYRTEAENLGLKNLYLSGFIPNTELPDYQRCQPRTRQVSAQKTPHGGTGASRPD